MPRLDLNTRKKVIILNRNGFSSTEIQRSLREEDVFVSHRSINRLLQKFRYHGSILDLPRKKRQKKINDEMKKLIDELMEDNDEMTATRIEVSTCAKVSHT